MAQQPSPLQDTAVAIGRRLAYQQLFQGQLVTTYFFVHPTEGLDKGMYLVPFAPGRCLELFAQLSEEISRANPTLRPHDVKNGNQLCTGQYRLGQWARTWGDEHSEYVNLWLLASTRLEAQYIMVSYSGPGAAQRIKEAQSSAVTSPNAQEAPEWRPLGTTVSFDVTGQPDTIMKFAREVGAKLYVLRSDYSRDRVTSDGAHWRSSYLTARIDCGERTMQLLRTDYYTSDHTFVNVVKMEVTLTAAMVAPITDWAAFYNFACGIP
jgi:hypothetical protein